MNDPTLAPLPLLLSLLAASLPFLALALRRVARLLPQRPAPGDHWPGAAALAVLGAPFLLLALVAALAKGAAAGANSTDTLSGLLASQAVLAAGGGLAIVLAARRARGLAGLGLAEPWPTVAPSALLVLYLPLFFVLVGLGGLWAHLCRARGIDAQQEVMVEILALRSGALFVAMLVAVLLGPFLEELLFRGFLQPYLGQFMSAPAALVVSSALFAGLHGVVGVPIFALSLLLGWLQQRTRCLWIPWSLHALHNGVMLALALALRPL